MLTINQMVKGLHRNNIVFNQYYDFQKNEKAINFVSKTGQEINTKFIDFKKKDIIKSSEIKNSDGTIIEKLYRYDENGDLLVFKRILSNKREILEQIICDLKHDKHKRVLKITENSLRLQESNTVKTRVFDFTK